MKKLIALLITVQFACNTEPREQIDYRFPKRPADIPLTTCDGTPIEWTWSLQRSYEKGGVKLIRKSSTDTCVIVVMARKYK